MTQFDSKTTQAPPHLKEFTVTRVTVETIVVRATDQDDAKYVVDRLPRHKWDEALASWGQDMMVQPAAEWRKSHPDPVVMATKALETL